MLQKRSLLKQTEHLELNTKITLKTWSFQARRQDSMTGGAREVYLCEFERGTRNLFQCGSNEQGEDQKKGIQFKNFHKFWSSSQNSCDFSRILKCRTTKKKSSFQKFYEIRCESTKIRKIRAVNTNLGVLGLDLHSNSPEPVNFFGAQSSLGGAQFSFGGHKQSFGGARPRNALPWRRAWVV